jgi:hypothetical protein
MATFIYSICVLLIITSVLLVVINFLYFLSHNTIFTRPSIFRWFSLWVVIITPLFFLLFEDTGRQNDCCSSSAFFSPEHRTSMYVLISLCMAAYVFSVFRNRLRPPLVELVINVLLVTGLVMNVAIGIHVHPDGGSLVWLIGNVPIMMLFLIQIQENMRFILSNTPEYTSADNKWAMQIFNLLKAPVWIKYPILLVMAGPLLLLLSLVLLVFGQRPDSWIRAFTDTYHLGLSQWDYMCDNVKCPEGHFLCTVGANGHSRLVRPLRWGIRNNQRIKCTRQLLVSNAFEQWMQEKYPALHRILRKNYNRVGKIVHRYYGCFRLKIVSDLIYLLMKPLEWVFLLVLYSVEVCPENRIHAQYLGKVNIDSR